MAVAHASLDVDEFRILRLGGRVGCADVEVEPADVDAACSAICFDDCPPLPAAAAALTDDAASAPTLESLGLSASPRKADLIAWLHKHELPDHRHQPGMLNKMLRARLIQMVLETAKVLETLGKA